MFIPLIAQKKNARNAKAPQKVIPTNGNHSIPGRLSFQMPIRLKTPGAKPLK
jgi:hypothetical protein